MICTACGMTGHRASTCPLELWRRVFACLSHGAASVPCDREAIAWQSC